MIIINPAVITNTTVINLYTGVFSLCLGLVILLATRFIEDRRIAVPSSSLSLASFAMGVAMTDFGLFILFLCVARKLLA